MTTTKSNVSSTCGRKSKAKPPQKPAVKCKPKAEEAGAKQKSPSPTQEANPTAVPTAIVSNATTVSRGGLTSEGLDYFKRVLNEKRTRILEKARDTLSEGIKLDEADLPDEYDMASSEYLQYVTLRLRGRERYFLEKIEQALARIENKTFGVCEICGEEIGMTRLMARPETTLCIRCKETQERTERQFGD